MATKWLDTEDRSILINEESGDVIGQAVRSGSSWIAYDNDPAKHDGLSAHCLGTFGLLPDAKRAVQPLLPGTRFIQLPDGTEVLIDPESKTDPTGWVRGVRKNQNVLVNERTGQLHVGQ